MVIIRRAQISQSAWTEWPDPPRATLRVTIQCVGRCTTLVDDIASELARLLPWGEYGTSIVPESTLPLDVLDGNEARLEIGALVVVTDPNQGQPEYEEGNPHPAVSDVRIRLEQPISQDLADRAELLARRDAIMDVIGGLRGRYDGDAIRAAMVPAPVSPSPWDESFGGEFG